MDHFFGRRPIFTPVGDLHAYGLIVRPLDPEGLPRHGNRDVAAARLMVKAFLDHGAFLVSTGVPIVVPVSQAFIDAPELICWPQRQVILAVPEVVAAEPSVAPRLEKLLDLGYRIALDDCDPSLAESPFRDRATVVAVDAAGHALSDVRDLVKQVAELEAQVLATNVADPGRLRELCEAGVTLFQGDYWKGGDELSAVTQVPGNRLAILGLLVELSDPGCPIERVCDLVAMDSSLTLRLLQYINSPISGIAGSVSSLKHAVVMVGLNTIKNWVMLLAVADIGVTRVEAVRAALVRARFCQLLAAELGQPDGDTYFTAGLISLLDSIVGIPMSQILSGTSLTDEIKSAVLEGAGPLGQAVYLAIDLEEGVITRSPEDIPVPLDRMAELYIDAIAWTAQTTAIL